MTVFQIFQYKNLSTPQHKFYHILEIQLIQYYD